MSKLVRRYRKLTIRKALSQLAPLFTVEGADLDELAHGHL